MADFSIRPRDRFIQEADWRKLYVLTKNWKSDLLFYRDDLEFLDHLVDMYFIDLSKGGNSDKVIEIEKELIITEKLCASLLFKVNKNLAHIADLIYNPFKYDSYQFRKEHQLLEDKLCNFLKVLKENKKEIFSLTAQVAKNEEIVNQVVLAN